MLPLSPLYQVDFGNIPRVRIGMFQSINKTENQNNNSLNFRAFWKFLQIDNTYIFSTAALQCTSVCTTFLSVADKHFNSLTGQLTDESLKQVGPLIQKFRFNLNLFPYNISRILICWNIFKFQRHIQLRISFFLGQTNILLPITNEDIFCDLLS